MRLSALQRANAARNAGKAKKAAEARRAAAEQELDWDLLLANLKAMLNRSGSECPQEAS